MSASPERPGIVTYARLWRNWWGAWMRDPAFRARSPVRKGHADVMRWAAHGHTGKRGA